MTTSHRSTRRGHRRLATLVITGLAAMFLGATPSQAAAQPSFDWVLLTFTAGPSGARDVSVDLHGGGEHQRSETFVLGFGQADADGPDVILFKDGGERTRLRTTRGAGSVDLVLGEAEGTDSFFANATSMWDELKPGERVSLLVFVAPATFDELDYASKTESGSGNLSLRQGSGSEVIFAAAAANEGVAVEAVAGAVGAAAGSSQRSVTTGEGLVGAVLADCNTCTAAWGGPEGRGGSATFSGGEAENDPLAFAGPAGQWDWSWSGLKLSGPEEESRQQHGETVLAAYAPIGDDWTLFAGDAEDRPPSPSTGGALSAGPPSPSAPSTPVRTGDNGQGGETPSVAGQPGRVVQETAHVAPLGGASRMEPVLANDDGNVAAQTTLATVFVLALVTAALASGRAGRGLPPPSARAETRGRREADV